MKNNLFARICTFRQRLLAAEAAHPDSPHLAALHEAANDLLGRFGHLFTEEQYQALSGGGPNKPPQEGGDG